MREKKRDSTITIISYLYEEDIESFLNEDATLKVGVAYEWEDEGVVHLRTQPAIHGYGKRQTCLFVKSNNGILKEENSSIYVVFVNPHNKKLTIKHQNNDFDISFVPSKADLYSRSKGLLEISVLSEKRVAIIGLGSFGANIAVELAKAGVGSFSLIDFDRVELHNLARHACGINDLGRLKTDVVADLIWSKNPYANVEKIPVDINDDIALLHNQVKKADIVICATDNNRSRFALSQVLVEAQKTCIFGRAVTRAEGGDVFRYRPGGPCYVCLIGNQWYDMQAEEITDEVSARRDGRIAAYVSPEQADAMVQVGLSADIEPIVNMMVKLALVELSRGTQSGIAMLEDELVFDYYMWANRRERRHANWAPLPYAGNRPTILRWYGAHIKRNEGCSVCGQGEIILDEGNEIEKTIDAFVNSKQ